VPFIELKDIEKKKILEKCKTRFVHVDNMTLSYWDLEPGAVIPDHSHPHEQVTTVISGKLEMTIGEETKTIGEGHVAAIPGNTPHSVKALSECFVIDVFYPVREDYK
jgi:quercetin dioxygenase-like cupin family protein